MVPLAPVVDVPIAESSQLEVVLDLRNLRKVVDVECSTADNFEAWAMEVFAERGTDLDFKAVLRTM